MKIKRYVRTVLVCLFVCLYVITDVAYASNSQQSTNVGMPKDSVVNKELGRYQEQPISLYTQVHLDFIGGQKYKERMNNTWAEIIYDGLTGFGSDAAEALYDVLDTPSDLLNFQKPSVFENPYDEIMMILIRSESGFSENTINLEYDRTLYDCVCDLNDVCDTIDPEWQMEDADFYEQFTELLNYADTVEAQDAEFYNKLLRLFSGNEEVVKNALNTFGKVSFFFDRVSDTVTVLNAVFDTVKYNATVKAYINCSDVFKDFLSDIETTMEKEAGKNASKKRYTPQIKQYDTYASQFKSAKEKYDRFLTDDVIADEILKEYMKEQVIDTTILLAGLTDDFCENIALNFVTKALDLSKETAQYVFAAVEAYKTGWAISEFLTGNETNMECRELARAYYYLENACVLTVKEYQGWLELNQQEEAAFKFDTAYRSLQTIECATLANYKEYLQAQDASLLRRVINFFTKHSNDDEIKICEQYASEWEDEKCHVSGKDFTSIAGQIVDKNDIPVEGLSVTISTDKTKNVIFSGKTDVDGYFSGEIKKVTEGLGIRVSDDNGMLLDKMLPGIVKYGHNELGVIKLNYFESVMTVGIESEEHSGEEGDISGLIEEYKNFILLQNNILFYSIYDIDKDGYPELFFYENHPQERESFCDIYSYSGGEFKLIERTHGPGFWHVLPTYASYPNGNGIVEHGAVKGYEFVDVHTLNDGILNTEEVYYSKEGAKYYLDSDDQAYYESQYNNPINHQYYQSETSSPYFEGSYLLGSNAKDNFTAVYEAFGVEADDSTSIDDTEGVNTEIAFSEVLLLNESESIDIQSSANKQTYSVLYSTFEIDEEVAGLNLSVNNTTETFHLENFWVYYPRIESVYVADIDLKDSYGNFIVGLAGEDDESETFIFAFNNTGIYQISDYQGRLVPESLNGKGSILLTYNLGMGIPDFGSLTIRPEIIVNGLSSKQVEVHCGRTSYSEDSKIFEEAVWPTVKKDLVVYEDTSLTTVSGTISAGNIVEWEYIGYDWDEHSEVVLVKGGGINGYVSFYDLRSASFIY